MIDFVRQRSRHVRASHRASSASTRSRWLVAVAIGIAGGAVLASGSCAESSSTGGVGGYGTSTGTGYTGAGGDAGIITPDGDMPPQRLTYAAFCGTGRCVPGPKGDSTACEMTSSVSTGVGGSGSSTGSSSTASSSSSSGSGGAGGTTSSSGAGGSGISGSSSATGGGPTTLGCQVDFAGGAPISVCAPTGTGDVSAPCQSATDCGSGLGCATDGSPNGVALCRPYCCGDFEECPSNTYCAKEPIAEMPTNVIPVCMPVTPCQLLTAGACPPDKTCSVVRADGTTSCIDKGAGELCQACPCAPGFECSATGICQKLCHTSGTSGECGLGTCQGGSMNLPSGIGLCVGGAADCSHTK